MAGSNSVVTEASHIQTAQTLCRQKLESMAYIFVADTYGSIFIHFFCGGLRKTHLLCNRMRIVQGHPRSLILAPVERAYATSY